MKRAEIIAIGNEVLLGDVQDTNTHWLCQQITGRGGRVMRATIVRDDEEAIADALHGSLSREHGLLIICGGLGPTVDDLTAQAVGDALGRPVEEHPQALAMVQAKYQELAEQGLVDHSDMTPERRKMARLPQGAEPLLNPVGGAPGVLLPLGKTKLICLPGVPEEMKAIFTTSLRPTLQAVLGKAAYVARAVTVEWGDESTLAPMVDRIAADHPDVYVKSRARLYSEGVHLKVTLSAAGEEATRVRAEVQRAENALVRILAENGIPIVSREDTNN